LVGTTIIMILPFNEANQAPAALAEKPALDEVTTLAQLKAAVFKTYREAKSLKFEADILSGATGETFHCGVVQENGGSVVTVSDEQGKAFQVIHHPAEKNGQVRVEEVDLRHPSNTPVHLEQVVPPDLVKLNKWPFLKLVGQSIDGGCPIGQFFPPWIGSNTYFLDVNLEKEMFPNAVYVGRALFEDRLCDVMAVSRSGITCERFYFDCDTHLLRRWYRIYKGVMRDRILTYRS
jgi:hypothetical protein